MLRYRRRYWAIAAALSCVAGFVDAIAFVHLGGFFVSFMSGNSTRLGVGLAVEAQAAAVAGGLILLFVCGVVLGSFANRDGARHGQVRAMLLVTSALAAAALLGGSGAPAAAMALLALAMGAENTVFQRDGEVSIGVTYMTGTLVKLGQRIAAAMLGKDRFSWAPYLLLWTGLVGGAALGALAYSQLSLNAVWIAAIAAALVAVVLWRLPEET